MKTTRGLLTGILLLAASTAGAQGVIKASGGSPLTLKSSTTATGSGTIQYQWYRNGAAIPNATGETYTIPAVDAYGHNVEFKRRATVNSSCLGEKEGFSNAIVITFRNLVINGVWWADANVDNPGTFASQPDMYTKFYQWNRATAWSATDETVNGWNSTPEPGPGGYAQVHPCPPGWGMPIRYQFQELYDTGCTSDYENSRGNAVNGYFCGPNHATCTLPNNMSGCIFLPNNGFRLDTDGTLTNRGGYANCWSAEQYNPNSDNAYYFGGIGVGYWPKAHGFSIRCMQTGN